MAPVQIWSQNCHVTAKLYNCQKAPKGPGPDLEPQWPFHSQIVIAGRLHSSLVEQVANNFKDQDQVEICPLGHSPLTQTLNFLCGQWKLVRSILTFGKPWQGQFHLLKHILAYGKP